MSENLIISQEYRILQPLNFYQHQHTQQIIEVHTQQLHEFYRVAQVQSAQPVAPGKQPIDQDSTDQPWFSLGEQLLLEVAALYLTLDEHTQPDIHLWQVEADGSTLTPAAQVLGPFRMAPADIFQANGEGEFGRWERLESLDALAAAIRRFCPDYYAALVPSTAGTVTWYPLEQAGCGTLGKEWCLFAVAGGVDVIEQLPGRTLYREAWQEQRYFVRHEYSGEPFPIIELINPISAPLLGFAPVPQAASAA